MRPRQRGEVGVVEQRVVRRERQVGEGEPFFCHDSTTQLQFPGWSKGTNTAVVWLGVQARRRRRTSLTREDGEGSIVDCGGIFSESE